VTGAIVRYDPDVKARCYEIWAGPGGGNAAATARYYEREALEQDPEAGTPTRQAIVKWAKEEDWAGRFLEELRRNHGLTRFELEVKALAALRGHFDVMLEAQAGAFDHNPAAGIVRLKPGDWIGRLVERGIFSLEPELPQAAGREWQEMSLEEQESYMRDRMQARKGQKGGRR
jgi:hypothetical protein